MAQSHEKGEPNGPTSPEQQLSKLIHGKLSRLLLNRGYNGEEHAADIPIAGTDLYAKISTYFNLLRSTAPTGINSTLARGQFDTTTLKEGSALITVNLNAQGANIGTLVSEAERHTYPVATLFFGVPDVCRELPPMGMVVSSLFAGRTPADHVHGLVYVYNNPQTTQPSLTEYLQDNPPIQNFFSDL